MELSVAAAIPIVVGLTEVIKRTIALPDRFNPLIALLFGIVFGLGISTSMTGLLHGVIIGLSASGLYRGTEVVIKNK